MNGPPNTPKVAKRRGSFFVWFACLADLIFAVDFSGSGFGRGGRWCGVALLGARAWRGPGDGLNPLGL